MKDLTDTITDSLTRGNHNLKGFDYPPTEEQVAIIDAAGKFPKVLVIEAGAGTGKTSTLEFLAATMEGLGQYTAFNRPLVDEATEKFARWQHMSSNSTHSLAFRAVGRDYAHRLGGSRVRSEQVAKMLGIKPFPVEMDDEGTSKVLPAGFLSSRVMMAITRFCQSADREIGPHHFRYIDGIERPISGEKLPVVEARSAPGGSKFIPFSNNAKVSEYLLPFAHKVWLDLTLVDGYLPFAHDHYVKIWQLGNPVISADYILLDEAQDTAPVFLDILARQEATVILVGDSAQQIYEWRGAVNALAAFPNAPRLYLTQSFRFGQAIADVANAILESLQEPTELRLKGLSSIDSKVKEVQDPRAILCRTNAAAVSYLLSGIAEGKQPFLVGGGADVIKFVKASLQLQKGKSISHPELACFVSWTEVQEYATLDEGEDLKMMVKLIDAYGAQKILNALEAMPNEEHADYVISTAHGSKGRQWSTVKVAPDFPTQPNSSDSDRRLLYVTVTRAEHILDIIDCPFFSGKEGMDVTRLVEDQLSVAPSKKVTGFYRPTQLPEPKEASGNGEFTWTKRDDDWCIRGPKGHIGQVVEVTRGNGSTSKKRLVGYVWESADDPIAVYSL